jgi:hypothetical protein
MKNILVHGGFVDGAGWESVYDILSLRPNSAESHFSKSPVGPSA